MQQLIFVELFMNTPKMATYISDYFIMLNIQTFNISFRLSSTHLWGTERLDSLELLFGVYIKICYQWVAMVS